MAAPNVKTMAVTTTTVALFIMAMLEVLMTATIWLGLIAVGVIFWQNRDMFTSRDIVNLNLQDILFLSASSSAMLLIVETPVWRVKIFFMVCAFLATLLRKIYIRQPIVSETEVI